MGNGALYMQDELNKKEENKMTICNLCETDISNRSYFLRIDSTLVEVCPECHHYYVYGTEEQKEQYKRRMNIK